MKPWEREVLEYRPKLGYTPEILSEVISRSPDAPAVFKPSMLASLATSVLASDLVDNTMASLSRVNNILNTLDRCQSGDPAYAAYRAAKDAGDAVEAERIYLENMQNINGNPQLDPIPVLEDLADEMETFLSYMNKELFDGKLDVSDMAAAREAEQKMVDSIFYLEANNKNVNYVQLMSRIRMITACSERVNFFQYVVDQAESYLTRNLKATIEGDAEGLLYYLSNMKESELPLLQQLIEVKFRRPAQQAANAYLNSNRAGQRELREVMDVKLSQLKNTFHTVYEPLLPYYGNDTIGSVGQEILKTYINEGIEGISAAYEEFAVDHIGTSLMNRDQFLGFFAYLNGKKDAQLLHKLIGTFKDEFDPVDLNKEVARFIKHHNLNADGSLCG